MMIGVQSFGGGSATLYLIRRVAVERHGWIASRATRPHALGETGEKTGRTGGFESLRRGAAKYVAVVEIAS